MTPDERWLDADEQAAWRGWLDTYRLLIPVLDRQLQSSRVSFTEYEVLVCLSEATDQRLRMSEVADRTLATRSAITRTVDRLVARGWVRRVRSMQDQRGAYANLTGSGADALAELAPGHVLAVRQNLIDLLTPDELESLRTIGRKVKRRLAERDGWSPRVPSAEPDPAGDGPFADPNGVGPEESAPEDSAPGESVPGESVPGESVPGESAPGESDPDDSTSDESGLPESSLQDPAVQISVPQDPAVQLSSGAGPAAPGPTIAAADTIADHEAVTAGQDR